MGKTISVCKVSDATGTLTITDEALNSGNAPLTTSQEATADAIKALTEFSNIEYKNVFALESVCDFPESIREGSSFEFIIDNKKENNCAVCLAYTPVPNKHISITVIKG